MQNLLIENKYNDIINILLNKYNITQICSELSIPKGTFNRWIINNKIPERNVNMIGRCDVYLPSTCYKGMNCYNSFENLPNKRGYGIKINKNIKEIKIIFEKTNWKKVSFLATNSSLNLRKSLIEDVIIKKGFYDRI